MSTDLSPADAGYTHPQDEPPPRRHWVCSGPGKQVVLLRNVSPPPGLAAASSVRLAPLSAGSALSSLPPVTYRHCPQDRGAPSLPTPEWPAWRFLRLLWVLVPSSSCSSGLETKVWPGERAGPALGSASPRLRPPLLAMAHVRGNLPVAISPGLLLPPFSFGPLKK